MLVLDVVWLGLEDDLWFEFRTVVFGEGRDLLEGEFEVLPRREREANNVDISALAFI